MKTKWMIIPVMVFVLACSRELGTNTSYIEGEFTLYATSAEQETKTVLQSDGRIFWSPSDCINVFYGSKSGKFTSTNTKVAESAEFTGSLGAFTLDGTTEFVATYPYSDKTSISGNTLNLSLPAEQTAMEGTFSDDLFICVAKSKDNNLHFYNVCGGVKFSLTRSDIKKVVFRGNNGEAIAGRMSVIIGSDGIPQITEITDGHTSVTLLAPDGATFKENVFYYLVLAPQTLSKGYTIDLYSDEFVGTISSIASVSVSRSAWGVIKPLYAEETLVSSTYGGKTYSIVRKNASKTDSRINGDKSLFYPCSFYVKVNNTIYDLPGTFYSYQDHRPDTDLGPIMAVDTRTGGMHVFFIEKDDYQPDKYSMRGHMFTILDGAISEQTIFTSDNFGWFPYFTWDAHQLVLNCFSFDQYFSITAAQFDNWALQKGGKIQPGDFSARQKANDLILFYETATPWEGEIVLEREYKVWSSGDYSTSWEGKTSANYAYPTIALVFDNDQSISIGYYNTYYWTSRSDRVFGIYIITGGQEQYVQARIVDEWVKEKFVINGNGVVRYYTNDVFMGEWTFYLDLASAHSVRVVGNPFGWWYTHYHYMDDFSLKTPATSVSDSFNDGEIDLTVWEQPVNPDGVYEEDGYLHMIQKRTDEDFTIRSKSILIVN